jgi:flagellar assembly protein FliH
MPALKQEREKTVEFEVFNYPAGPEPIEPRWEAFCEEELQSEPKPETKPEIVSSPAEAANGVEQQPPPVVVDHTECETRLAEEGRRSFEAGRERGRLEGKQTEQEARAVAQAAADQLRLEQMAALVENFSQDRESYLHNVEREVVKLALAVAARILRREAQMDPLLLSGAVRVALGQLSASTQVKLRVPPSELELWTAAIALVPKLAVRPQLLPGEGMRLGDCTIETEMGTVDLGVRAQLAEIERGFFDRPGFEAVPEADNSHTAEAQS